MASLRESLIRVASDIPELRSVLLPQLKKCAAAIEVKKEGRRYYLLGNTFPYKDDLRGFGANWDPQRRAWWISSMKWKKYEKDVTSLLGLSGDKQPDKDLILSDSVTALFRGDDVFLSGDTYAIKDDLKRHKFRWDGQKRMWFLPRGMWPRVEKTIREMVVPRKPEPKRTPGAASEKQINYAMRMIQRLGDWGWHDSDWGQDGSRSPTRKELEGWKAKDVSELISSLKDEF